MVTKISIGKKIQESRERQGLTQKDLADHLGKTSASISDIERGKVNITPSDLHELAKVLNMPISFFFEGNYAEETISRIYQAVRDTPTERIEVPLRMFLANLELQTTQARTQGQANLTPEEEKDIALSYYKHTIEFLYALDEMKRQTLEAKMMFEKEFGLSESDL